MFVYVWFCAYLSVNFHMFHDVFHLCITLVFRFHVHGEILQDCIVPTVVVFAIFVSAQ